MVTTSVATMAPVSEAIYGTGTVEPARWAKVVPLRRLCSLRRIDSLDRDSAQISCQIAPVYTLYLREPQTIADEACIRFLNHLDGQG